MLSPKAFAFVLLLISSLAPAIVCGQTPSATSLEQMQKLDFLIGEWKGKGSQFGLDGKPSAGVSQTTRVKKAADGSTISVDDKKKYPDLRIATGLPSPMVMSYPMSISGPASIYFDESQQLYFWRVETSKGRKHPFPAKLVDAKTLQVKLEFTGSLAVITIQITDNDEWHERLDMWMGDKTGWFKSQETVLKKVK